MIFAFIGMGPMEMMVIGAIAVILFGSKLPEVARSVGKSYREFRSGLNDFQSHTQVPEYPVNDAYSSSTTTDEDDEYEEATAPRFSPPPTDSGDEGKVESEAGSAQEPVAQDSGESEEAD
ncbi:MAG: twin-arginine translocase TatA/TatE family subunit [Pirellulaceae bacterium]